MAGFSTGAGVAVLSCVLWWLGAGAAVLSCVLWLALAPGRV
ncbi:MULTISPECIES: hypothetical protein [Limnospira]|uniref:Uncharacterized protein n=1 Tax=Limnospira indica PCC 8005 TaxID=376219 RepID=A0A9P1KBH2_9CYAN|nr:hypothetical protein [Limnospira indica]CDM92956.1 conserved exported protein of unknown function [Limnospira indica PCC 8005]